MPSIEKARVSMSQHESARVSKSQQESAFQSCELCLIKPRKCVAESCVNTTKTVCRIFFKTHIRKKNVEMEVTKSPSANPVLDLAELH